MLSEIIGNIEENIELKNSLLKDKVILENVQQICESIIEVYKNGGKVLLFGNGGSASDALHLAGELLGRFKLERKSLAAIALNADVATMTAVANDYGYEFVYSRQVEGLMTKIDIAIGFSTSGNSENVYNALKLAKEIGGKTVAFLGNDGGKIKDIVDIPLVIPSENTARIQECHILIGHIMCEIVEEATTNM